MEGCQLQRGGSKKMARRDAHNADRISNLPVQVLNLILSYLSIGDTVRTSILSKSWRHKWAKVPVLAFDEHCCSASSASTALYSGKRLVSIIDHVLMLHTGDLEVFKFDGLVHFTNIDRWILYVSRKSVREVVLHVRCSLRYKLPSSLYDCSSLIKLTLSNCSLKPPPTVHLERLKFLSLLDVCLSEDTFENLISSCPLLENLTLVSFQRFDNLHIKAPNLRLIDLSVQFKSIIFGCTLVKLSDIAIHLDLEPHSNGVNGPSEFGESGLSEFFTYFPIIQRLRVSGFFIKYLASGPIPEGMPFQFKDLYHLAVAIDFGAVKDCSAALCLLNSSPNLTELKINALDLGNYHPADSDKWWDESKCHQKFEKLRSVEVLNVLGIKAELNFVGFIVANSPVLRKMIVKPSVGIGLDDDFLVDSLRFKRASPQAQVIFVDWWVKRTTV